MESHLSVVEIFREMPAIEPHPSVVSTELLCSSILIRCIGQGNLTTLANGPVLVTQPRKRRM